MTNTRNDQPHFQLNFMRFLFVSALLLQSGTGLADPLGSGFSYQGELVVSGVPANGTYDLQFDLQDAAEGPFSAAPYVHVEGVVVQDGIFTVEIDFGGVLGTETQYWLEIGVREGDSVGPYTILAPRQKLFASPLRDAGPPATGDITSVGAGVGLFGGGVSGDVVLGADTNYVQKRIVGFCATGEAVRSVDVSGGVTCGGPYVLTTDPRLTDARAPTSGSANYIQNGITEQSSSNFNISGTGRADVLSAKSRFMLDDVHFLSGDGTNTYAGRWAGAISTIPNAWNTFVGHESGLESTVGAYNSFFGAQSGELNDSDYNTFMGYYSGRGNKGEANAFFGMFTGWGVPALPNAGSYNSFFGYSAGAEAQLNFNTFIGYRAGRSNRDGSNNTLLGAETKVFGMVEYATAIGSGAEVQNSNTIVLGRTADHVSMPGTATVGSQTTNYGQFNINAPSTNANFYMSGNGATKGINFGVDSATPAEAKLFISQFNGVSYQDRLTINENGVVGISILGLAGATSLCRNASNQFATCSSSKRYKREVEDFTASFGLIQRLRPVSFQWKESGMTDLGLLAEEVAEVEPLLVTYNEDGEIEGVKYDRIGVVLINVVKAQQQEIESLRSELEIENQRASKQSEELQSFRSELTELKTMVCSGNPEARLCN